MKVCHAFLSLLANIHSLITLLFFNCLLYFLNYLLYLQGLMAGTVILDDNGDSVADQMWEVVSSVISYSSDLMNGLFATVGAQQDEVSLFCRNFSSLADLRDEFICYLPRTFNYDSVVGNDIEQPNEDDKTGGTGPSIDELLAKRIERFAKGYV